LLLINLFFMTQLIVAAAGEPDFNRDIAPLIAKRCLECHNERDIKGEVNLTTHEGFTKDTKNGRLLLDLVTQGEMPPKQKGLSQKLPDDEIRLLEEWVESGAAWPSDRVLGLHEATSDVRAGRDWWSLQPVKRPAVPQLTGHPVDAFVRAKLKKVTMTPARRASRRSLARRVYFNLTGLPPYPGEMEQFLAYPAPGAWPRLIDRLLAVLKACHADSHAHGSALVAMNTGSTFIGRPSLGAWSVYGLGTENQSLPGYVVMLDKRGGPISGQPNWSSGFMPSTFQGTLYRPCGNPILDLKGPAHLEARAQRRQLDLLAKLNQKHLDERPDGQELATRIQSYELAYRMQAEAPEAVDLSLEKQATRDMYGIGQQPTDEYGRNCLIARRLVERGVRFIQLYSGGGHLEDTWDGHESIEKNHGIHGAEVDQPIAALLTDLEQRGLLDSTLVV